MGVMWQNCFSVCLWVCEHKPGKSCAKAALGYPSSHQFCQEPAAGELHLGCGAGLSSQHISSVSLGGCATSLAPLWGCAWGGQVEMNLD